ncbi:hypothetical protein B0T24DRAFT_5115 [Lasiosphaeria ovina]|uniref:Aminoglycoside phosphotransferase domain-containing protein n=1 Tax=Lasiosphaeria ovina TaxID=92902 RepID=A0AAE0NIZ1_9PEZI|nr:hypothetical protein B0T24DRAFT_5115 [Lasiosphaeria ovina]
METALPLLKGKITLQDALKEDDDIIQNLSYPEKRAIFWLYLGRRRSQITEIISRHLNISPANLRLGDVREWIHGSFNACIPIYISPSPRNPNLPERAIIRFPLPYKTGEAFFPGNVDEKLRCEAATYIWLHSNCPTVPIPRLYGFGFPGTQSFTALENESLFNRLRWYFRSARAWVSGQTLPPYFAHPRRSILDVGYLVIEHVGEGKMLSESWKEHRGDPDRRANLFRDLSRIILSAAKLSLPRIGSWTMDDRGVLSLSNRPLAFQLHQLENCNIPTEMPRDLTYTSVEPYLLDLIACHDSRIRHQPNSIYSQEDGEAQLSALATMRALLPKLTSRRLRGGPFVLTLTDLHQSNIFVDDDWHITRLIDLEWACVRPIEMLSPPTWLSSAGVGKSALGIDELVGEELDSYASAREEFMNVFEAEESALRQSDAYTKILRRCWDTGNFWYARALDCPTGLYALFMFHVQPRFADLSNSALDEFGRVVAPYWDLDAPDFILAKIGERERYCSQIRDMFAAAASPGPPGDEEKEDRDGASVKT